MQDVINFVSLTLASCLLKHGCKNFLDERTIFYILYEVFLLWAQFQSGFVTHRMHKTCGCPAA